MKRLFGSVEDKYKELKMPPNEVCYKWLPLLGTDLSMELFLEAYSDVNRRPVPKTDVERHALSTFSDWLEDMVDRHPSYTIDINEPDVPRIDPSQQEIDADAAEYAIKTANRVFREKPTSDKALLVRQVEHELQRLPYYYQHVYNRESFVSGIVEKVQASW